MEICLDIAEGCEFLEQNKIIHRYNYGFFLFVFEKMNLCGDVLFFIWYFPCWIYRDLAARNCLLSKLDKSTVNKTRKEFITKIGDFGFAKHLYNHEYYRHNEGKALPVRCI